MPLPAGGTWPPQALTPVTNTLAVWSAWYSGSPDQLSAIYGGSQAGDAATGFFASERGGWRASVGRTLARWFWGTQTAATEKRTKLHLPLAGDIAAISSDLLFSEPPAVTVEDETTQAYLDELVDDGLHAALLEAAEVGAALGGVYLRVCWDTDTSDRPWLDAVHADAAIPEWRYGRLHAVTFWRVVEDDGDHVLRHLERHEKGVILHGLYGGTHDELGTLIPLKTHEATLGLLDEVRTGIDKLTATYVPNMRPARVWRTQPAGANLGQADISGTESLMDALDETWSSWMRDVRLGKARLHVPATYLESQGRGKGAVFDADRELYAPVDILTTADAGLQIDATQFAIRVDEHQRTAQELITRIVSSAGYSAQTFGLSGDVAVTATEVVARERRSYVTRDRKIVYWRMGLADALETMLLIGKSIFNASITPDRPQIEFGDGVAEDPLSIAQTLDLLARAEAVSTDTKVRLLHPDWDDEQVEQEVEAIRDDAGGMGDPMQAMTELARGPVPPGEEKPVDEQEPPAEGQ